jgi:amidase
MKMISSDHHVFAFSPEMEPVLEVSPGERILFETDDCFAGQIESEKDLCTEIDFDYVNPATGPVAVSGAGKGDLLGVKIEDVEVGKQAVSVVVPGAGVLPGRVGVPVTRTVMIDAEKGTCFFAGISLPLKPMIGVIGVAPEEGTFPTGTPGAHGGNMDTTDIRRGTTVWFPVRRDGAMLAMGDCHAVMGDGEIGCSGAEVPAKVTVRLDLLKGASSPWPLAVTEKEIMVIASEDTLDQAAASASEAMTDLVRKGLGLSFEDALILCSLSMDLRISQVVDPKKTVRAVMPLSVLPWEKAKAALSER